MRDHRYRRQVGAGAGPTLAGTYRRRGDEDIVAVELGVHVRGSG